MRRRLAELAAVSVLACAISLALGMRPRPGMILGVLVGAPVGALLFLWRDDNE